MSDIGTIIEQDLQNEETTQSDALDVNELDDAAEEIKSETETSEESSESEETAVDVSEGTQDETQDVETPVEDNVSDLPYHERYYLKYREGKRSVALDLAGTKSLLRGIGFDGGELKQARKGKESFKAFLEQDKNKNNQMFCSYCGSEISGIEYYRLPDGRIRCTACNSTVVKSKPEMEELCKRVIDNMDSFFGATLEVPVSIEVLDELKLKKSVGIPLGTKDGESMLVLGVAVNKKKEYKILLENGAPRISIIATFAHELTHIWQYTHWDTKSKKELKKCNKAKRLLIYEGMAKWVEIQYLYLIGETAVAKREEYITRKREDEYGIGFCMYESKFPLSRETMKCDDTPFTPDAYPVD